MERRTPTTLLVPTGDEHPVRADLYLPRRAAGICVLCPGFKGHRNWGFIPAIARRLQTAGLAALTVDFALNGTIAANVSSGGPEEDTGTLYCEPALFRKNTITREIGDLDFLLRDITGGGLGGAVEKTLPIGLFGHSRAGVAVLLNALEHTQVRAVATWGTPVDPDIFTDEQKTKWREAGALSFTDSASGTALEICSTYLDNLAENRERFDLARAVARLEVPHLIVNGTADIPVPPDEAVQLYRSRNRKNPTRLLLLRAGHTFGADAALSAPTGALERATAVTVDWFLTHLTQGD